MFDLRKTMIAMLAVTTMGAGAAATAPHNAGQSFGSAAAAVATAEGGICYLALQPSLDAMGNIIDEHDKPICP